MDAFEDSWRDEELRLQLAGPADTVGVARSAVARFAAPRVPRDREFDLALIVSEVVTNAIRHGSAGGPIELRAVATRDRLRVDVTDGGAGLALPVKAKEAGESGGFGLFLVEQLARRWGLVRQKQTTRVWFEFDLA